MLEVVKDRVDVTSTQRITQAMLFYRLTYQYTETVIIQLEIIRYRIFPHKVATHSHLLAYTIIIIESIAYQLIDRGKITTVIRIKRIAKI